MPTRIVTPAELEGFLRRAGLDRAVVHLGRPGVAGSWAALDDGRWIYPASMIKLPLALALEAAVADGRLALDGTTVVSRANLTVNDKPSPLVEGYSARLGELEELMLARSDNVATNELIDVLGRAAATAAVTRLGARQTAIRRKVSGALPLIDDPSATGRNSHPAAEAAFLLSAVACDALPGAARVRDILGRQEWNEKLSRGLRAGDRFAHKTGDTDEVCHDGGILTTDDGVTYVLVVYAELPSSEANDDRFAAFMHLLRPLL